jgi:hypothetical protein
MGRVDPGVDDRDADAGAVQDLAAGVDERSAGDRLLRHAGAGRPHGRVAVKGKPAILLHVLDRGRLVRQRADVRRRADRVHGVHGRLEVRDCGEVVLREQHRMVGACAAVEHDERAVGRVGVERCQFGREAGVVLTGPTPAPPAVAETVSSAATQAAATANKRIPAISRLLGSPGGRTADHLTVIARQGCAV